MEVIFNKIEISPDGLDMASEGEICNNRNGLYYRMWNANQNILLSDFL